MRRVAKVILGTATAALIAAGPLAPPSGAATPLALTSASSCKQAADIEAIVDDSGSMQITDANRLRVQAMNLLIDTLGKSTQLGAVEFGSGLFETPGADTLFPPEPVGPNAATMRTALDQKIHAEFGIERLYLVSRGRRVSVGNFLGADEKASFAKALLAALQTAKRGITYNPLS